MKIFVPLLLFALGSSLAQGQTRPDFSGTWTMDMARSASAVQNEPIGQTTLVIKQGATQLSVETQRDGKSWEIAYIPGSADALANRTNRSNLLTSMWYWEGSRMITETVRDISGQTLRTREARTLDASGNEMTVEILVVVEHGYSARGAQTYGSGKDIYRRVASAR